MKEETVERAGLEVNATEFLRLSEVRRLDDDSGYCGVLTVRVGEFVCDRHNFYFDELPQFVERLRAAHQTLAGQAELRQRYEPEFIRVVFDSLGHVQVAGFLTDNSGCSLKFELEADQTFVPGFISGLERILRGLHA